MGGRFGARGVVVSLVIMLVGVLSVEAGFRSNGAGGCGSPKVAIDSAQDGDAIATMYDGVEGFNAEGATITKNIIIEGGWLPPTNLCTNTNQVYNTSADMLAAGFGYGGPANHSGLMGFSGPILSIDPAVKNLQFYATDLQVQDGQALNGGGISGPNLSGVNLRFNDVSFIERQFSDASVSGSGGGLFLDVNNGSHVSITDSLFTNQKAADGGGFNIVVRGNSQLSLRNVQVTNNQATGGSGGGGKLILYSGSVTITDSLFSGNSATASGGALRIERGIGATGTAEVWIVNTRFSGNSAPINADLSVGPNVTVRVLNKNGDLPFVINGRAPGAQINRITRTGTIYSVDYATVGFTPQSSGRQVHFFFDTVAAEQAGTPGSGPWFEYAGSGPFTGYGVGNRPAGATRLCILVANADHSIIPGTGNCMKLP
jgi:predicted outer membrane repeat protein